MKKKTKKVVPKIVRRRRKKTIKLGNPALTSDLEQLYKVINKVQTANETVLILVPTIESVVFENILKDIDLIFAKSKKKLDEQDVVEYKISPNPKKEDDLDFEDMETLPDEFFEDGQLFGI